MAIVSISELLGYNKCPELDARFANLLSSFLHKNEITETATHYVFTKDANTQISIPKNGGGGGASVTIADNLITNDAAQALSAAQGVVLKGLIDGLTTLLASDDTALDELQELVDFIKQNKTDLDTLSVANIAGLVDALALKTASGGYAGTTQNLKNEVDNKAEKLQATTITTTPIGNPLTHHEINLISSQIQNTKNVFICDLVNDSVNTTTINLPTITEFKMIAFRFTTAGEGVNHSLKFSLQANQEIYNKTLEGVDLELNGATLFGAQINKTKRDHNVYLLVTQKGGKTIIETSYESTISRL